MTDSAERDMSAERDSGAGRDEGSVRDRSPSRNDDGTVPDDITSGGATGGSERSAERADIGDELPEDLQPHLVDPEDYVFPNNNRRRVPGYLYLGMAAALVALVVIRGEGVYVNWGYLGAALVLGLFGVYSIISGWNLAVDEREALVAAIAHVGFPVGHASAQMGWRGLLSRPTWRILLYSADEPPSRRGFVLVDGVEPMVIDAFVEDNPEDWSELLDDVGDQTLT